MITPIRFGSQTIVRGTGDSYLITEEKIVDTLTALQFTRCVESVKVKNDNEALAEFLLLLDRHKAGEIRDPAIHIFDDANGQIKRIEKSWTVLNLH